MTPVVVTATPPIVKRRAGRAPNPPAVTDSDGNVTRIVTTNQAEQVAFQKLRSGLSEQQIAMIDNLGQGGVMTAHQLQAVTGLSYARLKQSQSELLLDRVRLLPDLHPQRLIDSGLVEASDKSGAMVYTLGMVGMALAKQRLAPYKPAPSGYIGFNGTRIIHDLMVNEIVLRMGKRAAELGWQLQWIHKQRASVFDEKGNAMIEPDALLLLRHPATQIERMLALEYHNEDRGARAKMKVDKYHQTFLSNRWNEGWDTKTMPAVAAVFRNDFVGQDYFACVKEATTKNGLKVRFIGKSLSDMLSLNADEGWVDFATRKTSYPLKLPEKK